MDRINLKIDGMTCGHCVAWVGKALKKLDGVNVESVAVGSATVSYDPAVISEQRIAEAVTSEGYPVVATTR
jgi:copper chaperone CopZ